MKKYLSRRSITIFLVLLLVVLSFCLVPRINQIRTILSLTKVDDYPLYYMKYYGSYHMNYDINNPEPGNDRAQTSHYTNDFSMKCSSFLARNENGDPIFCRNLDYDLLSHPITVLHTNPPGKNASLVTADLFYLGYSYSNPPTNSIFNNQRLLDAPRITIDGMNEYGLSLAILSVPYAKPTLDPNKLTTDEVGANRILLDHAKTVEEAIEELNKINIKFHNSAAHFMIADAGGNSAVVEFIKGEMKVVRNEKSWQVCTNFVLSEDIYGKVGKDRYDLAEKVLQEKNGVLSEEEAMDLLSKVSQSGTMWSVIYNLKTGDTSIAMGRKFDQINEFHLDMKEE